MNDYSDKGSEGQEMGVDDGAHSFVVFLSCSAQQNTRMKKTMTNCHV